MFYTYNRSSHRSNKGNVTHNSRHSRRINQSQQLDPRLFVQKAVKEVESVQEKPMHSFADFPVTHQLKTNITARNFTVPSPIQDKTIPHILQGRDLIGLASTGTGKTAAFLIPLIHKVHTDRSQKVLIMAPTRELAVQIETEFRHFAKNMQLYTALCIGGVGMYGQIRALQRQPQFVIGPPGRLRDLENQHRLSFTSYNNIVLDEVDRMLDMGFIHEMTYIISKLPEKRQSLFFSATLPPQMNTIMQNFLRDPITVSVNTSKPSRNVDQDVVRINGRSKVDILYGLLNQNGFDKVLVFGRTKWGIEKLSTILAEKGLKVAAIHGNKNQNQRQRAIELFKSNKIQTLIATDVASRGLDIDNVTHVINYDVPQTYEDYIHRIGRTGRAGKKGIGLTFI